MPATGPSPENGEPLISLSGAGAGLNFEYGNSLGGSHIKESSGCSNREGRNGIFENGGTRDWSESATRGVNGKAGNVAAWTEGQSGAGRSHNGIEEAATRIDDHRPRRTAGNCQQKWRTRDQR